MHLLLSAAERYVAKVERLWLCTFVHFAPLLLIFLGWHIHSHHFAPQEWLAVLDLMEWLRSVGIGQAEISRRWPARKELVKRLRVSRTQHRELGPADSRCSISVQ